MKLRHFNCTGKFDIGCDFIIDMNVSKICVKYSSLLNANFSASLNWVNNSSLDDDDDDDDILFSKENKVRMDEWMNE